MQLNSLIEKEKNLENLLLFALKNFAPNLFFKNNELKYWESILPELAQDNTSNNLIVEKSAFQKNDVLNKIFKELKNLIHCYRIIDNSDQTPDNPEVVSSVKINPLNSDKKDETITTEGHNENNLNKSNTGNINNVNEINDSFYYNQFTDWQKKIYDNFEENIKCLPEKEDANTNVNKYIPRINNNLQVVKRMTDDEGKFDEFNNPSGFFDVVTQKDLGSNEFIGNSNQFSNKKKKNLNNGLILMNVFLVY